MKALEDLRGVVRIAKAASGGIPGNGPRIERAELAIAAMAELIEASNRHAANTYSMTDSHYRLTAALASCGGAK